VWSCDDTELQAGTRTDSGLPPLASNDAAVTTNHNDGSTSHDVSEPDGTTLDGVDDGGDATTEGDAATCQYECYREGCDLENEESVLYRALRVPLSVFCTEKYCPESLTAFSDEVTCYDTSDLDAGADAGGTVEDGGTLGWWRRTEGCGRVTFENINTWHRYFNFDLQTGKLIGASSLDDQDGLLNDDCSSFGLHAGEINEPCNGETHQLCFGLPPLVPQQ
jgi:hypothetical protein